MVIRKSQWYCECVATTKLERTNRRIWVFAVVYSVAIMSLGVWVTIATGESIAIFCAAGLVILPVGAIGWRTGRRHHVL